MSHAGNLLKRTPRPGHSVTATRATVYNRLTGTVTWAPEAGVVIGEDQALYRVNATGVYLFSGTVPAYRAFRSGMSAGSDVRQLNRDLHAMGYDDNRITLNDEFTAATAYAINRWKRAHGMEQNGEIELGRIAFQPGARRVQSVSLSVGASAGSAGAQAAGAAATAGVAYQGASNPATGSKAFYPDDGHAQDTSYDTYIDNEAPASTTPASTTPPSTSTSPAAAAPATTTPATTSPATTSPATTSPAKPNSDLPSAGKPASAPSASLPSSRPAPSTAAPSASSAGTPAGSGAAPTRQPLRKPRCPTLPSSPPRSSRS